ncbi:MAG: DUF72 domain-containing protein [Acidobacteriaceae bacterium]|nr:DUF72 domain-containing protein [Acidobacteriaceae bacterium]
MIRIGPAGWTYKEWNGIFYPARRPSSFQELSFVAGFFDTVEINTSFYRPISPRMAASWAQKVENNNRFRFTAKLWRGFTHDRDATDLDEQRVKEGFAPLIEADRLGAVLLQFPPSFHNSEENRAYLKQLHSQFRDYPLVLEFRHASWNKTDVLRLLEQLGIGLCNIDQPIFEDSIAPSARTTSQIGYVRLHGRNYDNWWTGSQYAGARYDYLYSVEELHPWLDRIKAIDHAAEETYVIANNTYKGKGIVNALQLAALLTGKRVNAPSSLIETYGVLQDFTAPSPTNV